MKEHLVGVELKELARSDQVNHFLNLVELEVYLLWNKIGIVEVLRRIIGLSELALLV